MAIRHRHSTQGPRCALSWALAMVAACATAPAQSDPPTPPRAETPPPKKTAQDPAVVLDWVVLEKYSERASRAAFAACDPNSDDRLNIFEAAQALPSITSIRDLPPFRRLDTDVDGHISWPEFDRRFRELTDNQSPFRFRPVRPFGTAAAAGSGPGAELHRLLDRNGDGKVEPAEAHALLGGLGLSADAIEKIGQLDRDQSGDLSAEELKPLQTMLPKIRSAATKPGGEQLPDGYRANDANGDGVLDRDELGEALRRLHPGLLRWAARILRDADVTGNETLGPIEIIRADPQRPAEAKHPAGKRPR